MSRRIAIIHCSECGVILDENEMYCPHCGQINMDEVTGSSWPMWSITLLVAILGLLCILLIYEVATYEPLDQPPYYHTTINFARPEMTNRIIVDEVLWDASMEVLKVSPMEELPPWTYIFVTIEGSDGKILNRNLAINPYDVSRLDDGLDGTVEVQAWYIDKSELPKKLEPTDQVILTGLTKEYEGSIVEFDILYNYMVPSTVILTEFVS